MALPGAVIAHEKLTFVSAIRFQLIYPRDAVLAAKSPVATGAGEAPPLRRLPHGFVGKAAEFAHLVSA